MHQLAAANPYPGRGVCGSDCGCGEPDECGRGLRHQGKYCLTGRCENDCGGSATNETPVHQVFGSLYLKYTSVNSDDGGYGDVDSPGNRRQTRSCSLSSTLPLTYSADSPPVTLIDWTYGFNLTTVVLPMVIGDGTYAGILIVALELYYESLVHSYEPAERV